MQSDTDFSATLETIAPGFNAQLDLQQAPGEDWWVAAARIMSSLVMTEYQRQLLLDQIERARTGQSPAAVPGVTTVSSQGVISTDKPKNQALIYGAMGLALVLMLRGAK